MELSTIIPHIEALIFASDKPLNTSELVELVNNALGFIEDKATTEQVESAIEAIREKYNAEFYAFEMKESGGGWQFLTKKEYHTTIAQLNADKYLKKLSTASLETLSIIAYKQPITKSEIENIRGVNCDYAVQKLLEKELVVIAGRKEDAVGKPLIYTTSKSFMDYFGINSPEDLPKIKEVLMEELVEATKMNNEEIESTELEEQADSENPISAIERIDSNSSENDVQDRSEIADNSDESITDDSSPVSNDISESEDQPVSANENIAESEDQPVSETEDK